MRYMGPAGSRNGPDEVFGRHKASTSQRTNGTPSRTVPEAQKAWAIPELQRGCRSCNWSMANRVDSANRGFAPRLARSGAFGTGSWTGTPPPGVLRRSRCARAKELMATGVVGKGAADEHSIQKLAATPDFGQRRVVLQGVWIHGHGAIEYLAPRQHTVRPTPPFVGHCILAAPRAQRPQ